MNKPRGQLVHKSPERLSEGESRVEREWRQKPQAHLRQLYKLYGDRPSSEAHKKIKQIWAGADSGSSDVLDAYDAFVAGIEATKDELTSILNRIKSAVPGAESHGAHVTADQAYGVVRMSHLTARIHKRADKPGWFVTAKGKNKDPRGSMRGAPRGTSRESKLSKRTPKALADRNARLKEFFASLT